MSALRLNEKRREGIAVIALRFILRTKIIMSANAVRAKPTITKFKDDLHDSSVGHIKTVKVPLPIFPAISLAVAVQTLVVFCETAGAVKVVPVKLPPSVH